MHWYESTYDYFGEALQYAHKKNPAKHLINTEACIDAEVPKWKDDDWYWKQEATDWGFQQLIERGGIDVIICSGGTSSFNPMLLFRGKIQARVEPDARPPVDSLVGEIATPVEDMAPGAVGRVALRGSNWEARNEGDTALGANQRCRVTRVSGLQLGVVAE